MFSSERCRFHWVFIVICWFTIFKPLRDSRFWFVGLQNNWTRHTHNYISPWNFTNMTEWKVSIKDGFHRRNLIQNNFNPLSANPINCQIVSVCLTILWDWRLKRYGHLLQPLGGQTLLLTTKSSTTHNTHLIELTSMKKRFKDVVT